MKRRTSNTSKLGATTASARRRHRRRDHRSAARGGRTCPTAARRTAAPSRNRPDRRSARIGGDCPRRVERIRHRRQRRQHDVDRQRIERHQRRHHRDEFRFRDTCFRRHQKSLVIIIRLDRWRGTAPFSGPENDQAGDQAAQSECERQGRRRAVIGLAHKPPPIEPTVMVTTP